MTIEEMFGLETDDEYIARTSEEERVKEAMEYISGIIADGNCEEGYSTDTHVDELASKKYFDGEKAKYLKSYFRGFMDGYNRAKGENK